MWQFIRNRFIVATTSMLVTLPLLVAGQSSDTRSRIVELFQQAHQAEESNDFSHAVGLYRSIVAIDPNLAEVWSNLGVSLYHEHQYKDAIVTFQRGIALKPELLVPHLFTGMAYLNLGEADKALGPLKAALAIEPNNQESILALSEAYAQTRQFATAVRLLQKALKRDPDSESLGSNLAVTYLDWAKDIGIALRRTPSVYGRLLSDRVRAANDAASADQAFRDTIALAPGSVEARLAYARFLMEGQSSTERLRASEEQVNAADRIFPGDLDVSAIEIRLAVARKDIPRASTPFSTGSPRPRETWSARASSGTTSTRSAPRSK